MNFDENNLFFPYKLLSITNSSWNKSQKDGVSADALLPPSEHGAPDLHKTTFYANARDLWLFLFDSRNYYMDCIRMDENHILFVVGKAFRGSWESILIIPTTRSNQSEKMIIFLLFSNYMLCFWMRCSFSFLLQSMVGQIDGLLYYSFIFLWPSWFGVYVIFCSFAHSLYKLGDVYF